jgi:hypothetical protein
MEENLSELHFGSFVYNANIILFTIFFVYIKAQLMYSSISWGIDFTKKRTP